METNHQFNPNLENAYALLLKKIQEDSNRGMFFPSQHYIQKYSHFFEQWNFPDKSDDWKSWLRDFLDFNSLNEHFLVNDINELIIHPGTNEHNQFALYLFKIHCSDIKSQEMPDQENKLNGSNSNQSCIKTHLKTGEEWNQSVEHLSMKLGLSWNFQNPFLSFDCNWANIPIRLSLVHHALKANRYHTILLRKKMPMRILGNGHSFLYPKMISDLLHRRCNVVVCGSTGSGKTTLLRQQKYHLQQEHIISIEDVQELDPYPLHTSLVSTKNVSLEELMTISLRLNPDRIWPGEIRGKEIISFALALNTGHRGCWTTIHANSAADCLSRLCLLFNLYSGLDSIKMETAAELFTKNIDAIIFMKDYKVNQIIRWIAGTSPIRPHYEVLYDIKNHK